MPTHTSDTARPTLLNRLRDRWERWDFWLRHYYRTRLWSRPGFAAARVLGPALVGAVALAVRVGVAEVGAADLVIALAAVGMVAVTMLRPAVPPHAHRMDGFGDGDCPPAPRDLSREVLACRWLGVLTALALAVGLPTIVLVVLVALLTVSSVQPLLAKAAVVLARRRIALALAARNPVSALAYTGFAGGVTHLHMWEQPILASGREAAILNLRPEYCTLFRAEGGTVSPFVQLGSDPVADLRRVSVPSIRSYVYTHNAMGNIRFWGRRDIWHLWVGHGDSDKPASAYKRHAGYDVLALSGQAAIDRYARAGIDIPADKFRIVGRPQLGDVTRQPRVSAPGERTTVLYAPTWQGKRDEVNFCSIELAPQIVSALFARGARVVFRPHPLLYRFERYRREVEALDELIAKENQRIGEALHVSAAVGVGKMSLVETLNLADVLVSDVSSVVSEWLATGRPYAMVSTRLPTAEFSEAYPIAAAGYVLGPDLGNLDAVLDDLLDADPKRADREQMRERVLGGLSGAEAERAFADLVLELAERRPDRT